MGMENPEFLKEKYNLQNSEEVESAAHRTEIRTGEKVSQKPNERIQNYLDRFNDILKREDPEQRERGVEAIKKVLDDKFVIKPEDVPESYFDLQRRIAREQGHGDIDITDELRRQNIEVIMADQKSTLNTWIDYLSSSDAMYPDWLKYYAIRSVLGMGEYDKEKKVFTKRTSGTVKPFPDLNREALAYVLDALEKKYKDENIDLSALEHEDKEKFEKLLEGENFAKLYAWAIEKVTPAETELLANTKGEWVTYKQGSDHMPLVQSLQGKGTGWCTAGESTAEAQLKAGDFHVYYSLDKDGKPTIPRIAIRMQGGKIGEVRGIAEGQNLDSYITPVVQEKLSKFPDGKAYEKKEADMRQLTGIERKLKQNKIPTKEDLRFLWELDGEIQGFGYGKDPRVKELQKDRDKLTDVKFIFDANDDEVVESERTRYDMYPAKLRENTKIAWGKVLIGKDTILPDSLLYIDGVIAFSNKYEKIGEEVALKLLEIGRVEDVAKNLGNFHDLSYGIAFNLMDQGKFDEVAKDITSFNEDIHKAVAEHMLRTQHAYTLAKNISNFKGLDEQIAFRLIKERRGQEIAKNLNIFPNINQQQFFDKLVESGESRTIAHNFENFKDLDPIITAEKLIDLGYSDAVLSNLEKFKGVNHNDIATRIYSRPYFNTHNSFGKFRNLDSSVAKLILSNKSGSDSYAIADNLDSFRANHTEIASIFLETGNEAILANRLGRFHSLGPSIAYKLTELGYGQEVAHNIKNFINLDYSDIAKKIIDSGKGKNMIPYHGDYFKDLDLEVARKLIEIGEIKTVADHATSFRESDQYEIAKLLTQAGDKNFWHMSWNSARGITKEQEKELKNKL